MAKYHKYVFDTEARQMVGKFEEMYAAEDRDGFDSWHSYDLRQLRLRLPLTLLADYNFSNILDVGCGKGAASQFLKRKNNRVLGVDMSPTAIAKAQASFPDIEFRCMNALDIGSLGERFDLASAQGILAYISKWKDLLATAAAISDYCLVAEYIPKNPIGEVKSAAELIEGFGAAFNLECKLVLDDEIVILFGRSRSAR